MRQDFILGQAEKHYHAPEMSLLWEPEAPILLSSDRLERNSALSHSTLTATSVVPTGPGFFLPSPAAHLLQTASSG